MQQEINKENVVLLPQTNSHLYIDPMGITSGNGPLSHKLHYLYITEPVKDIVPEGEWYIDDTNALRQSVMSDKEYWEPRKHYKQVIASNNPALSELPGINEEFIKSWVSVQDKEYKVMIEMDVYQWRSNPDGSGMAREYGFYSLYKNKDWQEADDNPPRNRMGWNEPKLSNNQLILYIVEEKQETPAKQQTTTVDVEQLAEQYCRERGTGYRNIPSLIREVYKAGHQQGVKQVGWTDAEVKTLVNELLYKSVRNEIGIAGVGSWLENYKRSK